MKENETYTTPEGKEHKILMFDEVNKQVYINIIGSQHRWVTESEYSTWTPNSTADMSKIYVPDIPAQMIEETTSVTEPEEKSKKKTTKKKSDDSSKDTGSI